MCYMATWFAISMCVIRLIHMCNSTHWSPGADLHEQFLCVWVNTCGFVWIMSLWPCVESHHRINPHYDSTVYYLARPSLLPRTSRPFLYTCASDPFCDHCSFQRLTLPWRLSRSMSRYTNDISLKITCYTHSQSHAHTRTHTHSHTHSFTCTRTRTHTHTHARIPNFHFFGCK